MLKYIILRLGIGALQFLCFITLVGMVVGGCFLFAYLVETLEEVFLWLAGVATSVTLMWLYGGDSFTVTSYKADLDEKRKHTND